MTREENILEHFERTHYAYSEYDKSARLIYRQHKNKNFNQYSYDNDVTVFIYQFHVGSVIRFMNVICNSGGFKI